MGTETHDATDGAEQQARAHLDSIAAIMAAIEAAEKSSDGEATYEGEVYDPDSLRAMAQGFALAVSVTDSSYSPGDPDRGEPERYEILLCVGGPSVRIVGQLGPDCEPANAGIEYRRWFASWIMYRDTTAAEDATLEAFARLFWFGE